MNTPSPLDATIETLKSQHGTLASVEADGETFLFRKPTRQEYNRWFDKREERPTDAGSELVQSCLVHPGRDAFIAILDKRPALLMQGSGFLDAVTDIAGAAVDSKPKKKIL